MLSPVESQVSAHKEAIIGTDVLVDKTEILKFKALALCINGDKHFAGILQTVPDNRRKDLYNIISKHLSFKPRPFSSYKFY